MKYGKDRAQRNKHLLAMARGKPCFLSIPNICCGDTSTTVSAHSNFAIHGKGAHRKADDHYTVYACVTCHMWLDQSSAKKEDKMREFLVAHGIMVEFWKGVAEGAEGKDRQAAIWALERVYGTLK